MKLIHAIMAGGIGSRLWPLSRKAHPKQFLNIASEKSMMADTLTRYDALDVHSQVLLCSEAHKFLANDILKELGVGADIILEPMGRDTAPAAMLAALYSIEKHEDALILLSPSDHAIKRKDNLINMIEKSLELAEQGHIITFGINPSSPETGYGYIKTGKSCDKNILTIDKFEEKPTLNKAKKFLDSNKYLWNSGIFLFRASVLVEEIKKYAPNIEKCCQMAHSEKIKDKNFYSIDSALFSKCPKNSLDYAVMENTTKGLVAKIDADWSDLGSWKAIWEFRDKDKFGNAVDGDVNLIKTNNCLIHSDSKHFIATIGVDNLAIIETNDSLLVANLDASQEVKELVNYLKEEKRAEYVFHREVHRPWGQFDSIGSSHRYQVKRITVKPGQKLSVQMHYHRAEHWIVVGGTAVVKKGFDKNNLSEHLLRENESIYIEIGEIHSLENPGKVPLELIEVQSGTYLGEDDIVRFSDIYGRGN